MAARASRWTTLLHPTTCMPGPPHGTAQPLYGCFLTGACTGAAPLPVGCMHSAHVVVLVHVHVLLKRCWLRSLGKTAVSPPRCERWL
jgi:hypothetical protein